MPKRVLQGVVVSDANAKTVVVQVERRFIHPVMGKTVRRSKKYQAHDEEKRKRHQAQAVPLSPSVPAFRSRPYEKRCRSSRSWSTP